MAERADKPGPEAREAAVLQLLGTVGVTGSSFCDKQREKWLTKVVLEKNTSSKLFSLPDGGAAQDASS